MEFLRVFKGFDGKTVVCHQNRELEHAIRYLNPAGEHNIEIKADIDDDVTTYHMTHPASSRWCRTEPFERSSGA